MPELGAMSYVYAGRSAREMAAALQAHGLTCVQVDPRQAELMEGEPFGERRARAIREALAERGVRVAGLSGYVNLLDPDPAKREANVAMLERMIELAEAFGTPYVLTETGSLHPANSWRPHPDNDSEDAWKALLSIAERLRVKAARHGAVLLLEGFVYNVLSTPERAEAVVRELGTEGLGLVMDPFNYMTEKDLEPDRQQKALDDLFRRLAPYCPIAHAKDAVYAERGFKTPRAGTGAMKWELAASAFVRHMPDAPLLLEHLQPDEVEETLRFVRRQIGGVAEVPVERAIR
ncbi:sugar phosphate isomerase/epimerase [Cohnella sp. CBP 2801]|uniref:Sugar phosphate isomerase/epimerase n=1 Tax=Cohnella zeiphila TaxID=2761120 RepID=A0A7X0SV53_9BACL|nr:sugar phosphate isomerase/epimerase [Cohnella zeiphila]